MVRRSEEAKIHRKTEKKNVQTVGAREFYDFFLQFIKHRQKLHRFRSTRFSIDFLLENLTNVDFDKRVGILKSILAGVPINLNRF